VRKATTTFALEVVCRPCPVAAARRRLEVMRRFELACKQALEEAQRAIGP